MTTIEYHRIPRSDGAAYMRAYRTANPDKADRDKRVNNARNAALRKLVELHPGEMRELYDLELRAAGLR